MIVQNAWYLAAWASEVSTKPLARRVCNEPVVLFRLLDGKAAALIDSCAHRGAPLSLGTVVEKGIRCNYHGVVYGSSGVCTGIPNQDVIPPQATQLIAAQVAAAILEDKLFIEAQQERVEELGEDRLYANAADAARIMARRAVARYNREHNPA